MQTYNAQTLCAEWDIGPIDLWKLFAMWYDIKGKGDALFLCQQIVGRVCILVYFGMME